MNAADKALVRARELYYEDPTDGVENELSDLIPVLVEAGYAVEEPGRNDPDRTLWSFTEAGRERADALGID